MFEKLRHKWKVDSTQLFLVITTFAVGGSLTGIAARKLMTLLPVQQAVLWTILYIIIMTLTWPVMVLVVSIPLGQFPFFKNYLARIASRISGSPHKTENVNPHKVMPQNMNIAIFASGAGSNARKIIEHFSSHPQIKIALVVCNKPGAGVLDIAAEHGIPTLLIEKEQFFRGDTYLPQLKDKGIGFIVLAGFLWKIPAALIAAFPHHIINIHPALLPKYGGKGMYGSYVHEAVIAAGEKESGITIHYVDEQYDHGGTIFQATCPVEPGDTPASLAQRIHSLEHAHYPAVIEQTILSQLVKNH
ncbi:phosphoribosylglycinamide formyltransferase [Flavihumibacter stibioxidans]|nr:phosphoribosylglycinamide formyltransferase [Flavihumibacter stibioxidans]